MLTVAESCLRIGELPKRYPMSAEVAAALKFMRNPYYKFHPNVDQQAKDGATALIIAVQNENVNVARELATRAKLNLTYKLNTTSALHNAVMRQNLLIIEILEQQGASLNQIDR